MARRSEHSLEEIKEMVLKAAENIVIEEGYSALTVRKIALEIGYTVGSIYMVFDNMADLGLHIKGRTLDDIAVHLDDVDDAAAEQCIEALARAYLLYANRNFNRWRMIFEHRLPEQAEVPDWYQAKIDQVFKKMETQFARLAPQCDETQRKRAARALWGGIHGICELSLTGKLDLVGVHNVEESVVLLVRNFIRGWVAEVC
ncbi:MAG: TetR/AcrR family transcriptional regulator [Methylobacter sp.]|uniref:TetR/AcrR family transcriptional regulator n=1 Tax=Methylobacter sp. TaxID=2051955 RepID=UPI0025878858|nr:TetR/AcrR family transcriptional regulator [Methylobacter sp.]MCL7421522.1 TetR/AcrR family transcriptional regulator [Methylobacter sp.]